MLIFMFSLTIISILLGSLTNRGILKSSKDLPMMLIMGVVMMLFIFELLAVSMIMLGISLSILSYTWIVVMGVLSLLGLVLNYGDLLLEIKKMRPNIKKVNVTGIITLLMIIYQIYISSNYAYMSANDAYYVGTAVTSYDTNTMFRFSPFTGQPIQTGEYIRHVLSPLPVYFAVLGKIFRIHPATIMHHMVPVFFIPLVYLLYYQLSKLLFYNKKSQINVFMLILAVIHLFAGKWQGTPPFLLMTSIWQGEGLLVNLILPFIIYHYMLYKRKQDNRILILIFCGFCSGIMVSTKGFTFCLITLILLIISAAIDKGRIMRRNLNAKLIK